MDITKILNTNRVILDMQTAYEIPKRDWSSDVCSSDLRRLKN